MPMTGSPCPFDVIRMIINVEGVSMEKMEMKNIFSLIYRAIEMLCK